MHWFCSWAWRLFTERVVAQPLHLYLFTLGVKVFGYYWMAASLYSFMRLPEGLREFVNFVYMYSVILGIQVL